MKLTRLDRLRLRLEAQNACLGWALGEIGGKPGLVFELGLGHGRTYDHLRTHLPDREIYVFDKEIDCYEDCIPPKDRMLLGPIDQTLKDAAERFPHKAILVHSDMGSYTEAHNTAMSALLSRLLPGVLAPGAIVLSDLPLTITDARPLPLPFGAQEGRYFIYRMAAQAAADERRSGHPTTSLPAQIAYAELIDRYCAVWGDPDGASRAAQLALVWGNGATYTDPTVHAVGADALLSHIEAIQSKRPGFKVMRTSGVDTHHGIGHFSWQAVSTEGAILGGGIDIAFFSPDVTRIDRIIGFFKPFAAQATPA